MPVLGFINSLKNSGCNLGSKIVLKISSFASYRPPISSHLIVGIDALSKSLLSLNFSIRVKRVSIFNVKELSKFNSFE